MSQLNLVQYSTVYEYQLIFFHSSLFSFRALLKTCNFMQIFHSTCQNPFNTYCEPVTTRIVMLCSIHLGLFQSLHCFIQLPVLPFRYCRCCFACRHSPVTSQTTPQRMACGGLLPATPATPPVQSNQNVLQFRGPPRSSPLIHEEKIASFDSRGMP